MADQNTALFQLETFISSAQLKQDLKVTLMTTRFSPDCSPQLHMLSQARGGSLATISATAVVAKPARKTEAQSTPSESMDSGIIIAIVVTIGVSRHIAILIVCL